LIYNHALTSKRKNSKKENPLRREGGKGGAKSGGYAALKRKPPPPFPPGSGRGNDGKPYRVYHITTASAYPLFPLWLSPLPREERNIFLRA